MQLIIRKKVSSKILSVLLLIGFGFILSVSSSLAASNYVETERAETPEVKRNTPILQEISPSELPTKIETRSMRLMPAVMQGSPVNLIINGELEESSDPEVPSGWFKGGYGTNVRLFTYPQDGIDGSKAIQLNISSYTSGDAKWYFSDIPVTGGKTYVFTNQYKSNINSIVDVRFLMSDGSYKYDDIAFLPASAEFSPVNAEFVAPSGAQSATVFHLIKAKGQLTTDNYSLVEKQTPPVIDDPDNFIPNGNFEISGTNNLPENWIKGGWGSNSRSLTYSSVGIDGSKGGSVSISSYTSGDAKWAFKPISLAPGVYRYSDEFKSNVKSYITMEILKTNGSFTYTDLAIVNPSSSFGKIEVPFTVPTDARYVTIFHLIKSVGNMTIDNAKIITDNPSTGLFNTGGVTFRFDDGWISQYENALPILEKAGFKGSFFMVSDRTPESGFPAFMSVEQIKDLYNKGHEIGAHSISHSHLTNLTYEQQRNEIFGSRAVLQSYGVGPINNFVYPFGEYNSNILNLVKEAGYNGAVTTMMGFVTPTTDEYQLESKSIKKDMTLEMTKNLIDEAVRTKKWFIMGFHRVDYDIDLYSTTPEMFSSIIDYIKLKNIAVVTINEGLSQMTK